MPRPPVNCSASCAPCPTTSTPSSWLATTPGSRTLSRFSRVSGCRCPPRPSRCLGWLDRGRPPVSPQRYCGRQAGHPHRDHQLPESQPDNATAHNPGRLEPKASTITVAVSRSARAGGAPRLGGGPRQRLPAASSPPAGSQRPETLGRRRPRRRGASAPTPCRPYGRLRRSNIAGQVRELWVARRVLTMVDGAQIGADVLTMAARCGLTPLFWMHVVPATVWVPPAATVLIVAVGSGRPAVLGVAWRSCASLSLAASANHGRGGGPDEQQDRQLGSRATDLPCEGVAETVADDEAQEQRCV
jgi:hypothetical protein